jgi:hypothetical protein
MDRVSCILLGHVLAGRGWKLADRGDGTFALCSAEPARWPRHLPVPRITCRPLRPGGAVWWHWVGERGLVPICPRGRGDDACRLIVSSLAKHLTGR